MRNKTMHVSGQANKSIDTELSDLASCVMITVRAVSRVSPAIDDWPSDSPGCY